MNLEVYLTFNGECEDAFNFYQKIFNAETLLVTRYEEMHDLYVPKEWKKKIVHAVMTLRNGIQIMGSDTMYDKPVSYGENMTIALTFVNREDEIRVFNALSDDNRNIMPLHEASWDSLFGMVTDKYGIRWMLNCFNNSAGK